MTKLCMFYVWAYCHTADINMMVQLFQHALEHVLFSTRQLLCCIALDSLHLYTFLTESYKLKYMYQKPMQVFWLYH
jgi:hypothetical protein